jgi:hypothetical protein
MKRIVLAALLASCGGKSEKVPTCAEVTDHMLALMQIAYPGHGDMGAMGNRKLAIEQCEARKLGPDERRCIMKAKASDELGACRRARMGESAAPRPGAPPAPPAQPSP